MSPIELQTGSEEVSMTMTTSTTQTQETLPILSSSFLQPSIKSVESIVVSPDNQLIAVGRSGGVVEIFTQSVQSDSESDSCCLVSRSILHLPSVKSSTRCMVWVPLQDSTSLNMSTSSGPNPSNRNIKSSDSDSESDESDSESASDSDSSDDEKALRKQRRLANKERVKALKQAKKEEETQKARNCIIGKKYELVVGGLDGYFHGVDIDNDRINWTCSTHGGAMWSIGLSTKSQTSQAQRLFLTCDDGSLKIFSRDTYSTEAFTLIKSLENSNGTNGKKVPGGGRVRAISQCEVGNSVFVGDEDSKITKWNSIDFTCLAKMKLEKNTRRNKANNSNMNIQNTRVWTLVTLNDDMIASGDNNGRVSIWCVHHCVLLQSFESHQADVLGLFVMGDSLFSAAVDSKISQFRFLEDQNTWNYSGAIFPETHDIKAICGINNSNSKTTPMLFSGGTDCSLFVHAFPGVTDNQSTISNTTTKPIRIRLSPFSHLSTLGAGGSGGASGSSITRSLRHRQLGHNLVVNVKTNNIEENNTNAKNVVEIWHLDLGVTSNSLTNGKASESKENSGAKRKGKTADSKVQSKSQTQSPKKRKLNSNEAESEKSDSESDESESDDDNSEEENDNSVENASSSDGNDASTMIGSSPTSSSTGGGVTVVNNSDPNSKTRTTDSHTSEMKNQFSQTQISQTTLRNTRDMIKRVTIPESYRTNNVNSESDQNMKKTKDQLPTKLFELTLNDPTKHIVSSCLSTSGSCLAVSNTESTRLFTILMSELKLKASTKSLNLPKHIMNDSCSCIKLTDRHAIFGCRNKVYVFEGKFESDSDSNDEELDQDLSPLKEVAAFSLDASCYIVDISENDEWLIVSDIYGNTNVFNLDTLKLHSKLPKMSISNSISAESSTIASSNNSTSTISTSTASSLITSLSSYFSPKTNHINLLLVSASNEFMVYDIDSRKVIRTGSLVSDWRMMNLDMGRYVMNSNSIGNSKNTNKQKFIQGGMGLTKHNFLNLGERVCGIIPVVGKKNNKDSGNKKTSSDSNNDNVQKFLLWGQTFFGCLALEESKTNNADANASTVSHPQSFTISRRMKYLLDFFPLSRPSDSESGSESDRNELLALELSDTKLKACLPPQVVRKQYGRQ